MKYTVVELDCQLSEIIDCYDTDDAHDAWSAYVRMKNSASKIRYSEGGHISLLDAKKDSRFWHVNLYINA